MKKNYALIGIIALALSLSTCGTNQNNDLNGRDSLTEPKINETNSDSFSSQNNTNLIQPTEPVSTTTSGSAVKNDMTRTLENQTDLFKDYSGAIIKTTKGNIEVKFYPESPITVNNFMNLAKSGFYNDTKFHRIIKDFMIQAGDPLTKEADTSVYGTGGPEYRFADEFNNHKLVEGSLAMANAGPGTNGSQFFIVTTTETPWLDGKHTNFGEVVKGLDVVKEIEAADTNARDLPLQDIVVKSIELVK